MRRAWARGWGYRRTGRRFPLRAARGVPLRRPPGALPGRPEHPVAGIPEPRPDEGVVVDLAVERGGPDGDARVGGGDGLDALRRADQADEAEPLGAGLLQPC